MANSLPTRDEIPEEEKWNLELVYGSVDEWEEDYEAVKAMIPEVAAFKGKLDESAETLYEALQKRDQLTMKFGKLVLYATRKSDEDTSDSTYQALKERVMSLASQTNSQLAYMVPEILSIDEAKLKGFIEDYEPLQLYRQQLEEINQERPHILPEEQESLLAQAGEVLDNPSSTFNMLNNADMTFPKVKNEKGEEVELSHGRYGNLIKSDDREVRKQAFEAMFDTYASYKNTLASTLGGVVKHNNFTANVRNYRSAREAALSSNHIPEEVYDNLLKTINDNLHLQHRYVKLKKQALELDDIHMYDLYTPLVKNVDMDVSYDKAKDLVLEGLQPLGQDYLDVIKEGYKSRWIDVRETKNKQSGAYSASTYGTAPYILLNWSDDIRDVFTLAHELGHSMHSYYSSEHQPYPYHDYTIFNAEVASTCNEALLNDYLLKNTNDRRKRMFLLNNLLEDFRATVFRQTMFAEFEQIIHEKAAEGHALTPDFFTSIYYDLNKKYFGDDITVDERIGYEWSRIPHFYRSFYVYQYATGYSAAAALSKQIIDEGQPAVERYKGFLQSGSSDYSINLLKNAGVDMTTSKPIEEALSVFEGHLDELEKLLQE